MANFSASGAVCWEAESSWGEDLTSFATDRVAVLESVDISGLGQDVLEPGKVNQYRNEGQLYIRGPMNATFRTKVYLNGHGSTMVGSPTIDPRGRTRAADADRERPHRRRGKRRGAVRHRVDHADRWHRGGPDDHRIRHVLGWRSLSHRHAWRWRR